MPFGPGGIASLPPSTFTGVVPGGTIRIEQHTPAMRDIESMLSAVLKRDGRDGMIGNLTMASFRITGLGDGINAGDAINKEQFDLVAAVAVTLTGVQTLTNKDLTAATNTYRQATEALLGALEIATTAEAQAGVDDTRAITPAKLQSVTSTETRKGVVELATTAEAVSGTDTTRAVTPAGLRAGLDANVYNGSDQNNLAYPIGTTIVVNVSGGAVRNQNRSIYLTGTNQFQTDASGTALTGTWRARGVIENNRHLFQRTA